jgi:hypothetical protein
MTEAGLCRESWEIAGRSCAESRGRALTQVCLVVSIYENSNQVYMGNRVVYGVTIFQCRYVLMIWLCFISQTFLYKLISPKCFRDFRADVDE